MIDMPKTVKYWYEMWINAFPESWHENDLERFYMFVHRLLSVSKKDRPTGWLEKNLKADCKRLSDNDIEEYCKIFQHLKAFKNVWKGHTAKLIAGDLHRKNREGAI